MRNHTSIHFTGFSQSERPFEVEKDLDSRLVKNGFDPVTIDTGDGDAGLLFWKGSSVDTSVNKQFENDISSLKSKIDSQNIPTLVKKAAKRVLGEIARRHHSPMAAYQVALRNLIQEDSACAGALMKVGIAGAFRNVLSGSLCDLLTPVSNGSKESKGYKEFQKIRTERENKGLRFGNSELESLCGELIIHYSAKIVEDQPLEEHSGLSVWGKRALRVLQSADESDLQQGIVLGIPNEFAQDQTAIGFEIALIAQLYARRMGLPLSTAGENSSTIISTTRRHEKSDPEHGKIFIMSAEELDFHFRASLEGLGKIKPSIAAVLESSLTMKFPEEFPMTAGFGQAGIYFFKTK